MSRGERHLAAVRNSGAERKFLRLPDVVAATGLSRASIYRLAATGTFPRPVRLAARTSAWLHSEIDAWCDAQVAAARDQKSAA